jgi:hypothetical protein
MSTPILLLDRFLCNAGIWVPNSGPSINDPPSLLFIATPMGDNDMTVQNALDKPYAGALVSNTGSPYNVNGVDLTYSAWHFEFMFLAETFANLARFETDCKACWTSRPNSNTKIRNVANYSVQWNRDTGEVQIDHDPPAWVGSGFLPTDAMTAPDVWHSLDFRYSANLTALTFSIDSINWDGTVYNLPPEHKNIAFSNTNWERCRKLQYQTEGYGPGTVLFRARNGAFAWSNQPIPATIPQHESYGDGNDGIWLEREPEREPGA